MKYILILIVNVFFILYSIMFFADHKFVPEGVAARIRNLLLLCSALYVSYNVLFIYILKKEQEQSGIIYKIASGVKQLTLNSYTFIQPFQKDFVTSLIIAGIIIVVSVILLGMPGGLIIEVIQNILPLKKIEGDNMWPAALYVSFFWPLYFPIAVLTKNYFIQHAYTGHTFAGLSVIGIAWVSAILCSAFLLFAGKAQ